MSKKFRLKPVIPPSESARLARNILMPIIEYLESEEGQKAYEEWVEKTKKSCSNEY